MNKGNISLWKKVNKKVNLGRLPTPEKTVQKWNKKKKKDVIK